MAAPQAREKVMDSMLNCSLDELVRMQRSLDKKNKISNPSKNTLPRVAGVRKPITKFKGGTFRSSTAVGVGSKASPRMPTPASRIAKLLDGPLQPLKTFKQSEKVRGGNGKQRGNVKKQHAGRGVATPVRRGGSIVNSNKLTPRARTPYNNNNNRRNNAALFKPSPVMSKNSNNRTVQPIRGNGPLGGGDGLSTRSRHRAALRVGGGLRRNSQRANRGVAGLGLRRIRKNTSNLIGKTGRVSVGRGRVAASTAAPQGGGGGVFGVTKRKANISLNRTRSTFAIVNNRSNLTRARLTAAGASSRRLGDPNISLGQSPARQSVSLNARMSSAAGVSAMMSSNASPVTPRSATTNYNIHKNAYYSPSVSTYSQPYNRMNDHRNNEEETMMMSPVPRGNSTIRPRPQPRGSPAVPPLTSSDAELMSKIKIMASLDKVPLPSPAQRSQNLPYPTLSGQRLSAQSSYRSTPNGQEGAPPSKPSTLNERFS